MRIGVLASLARTMHEPMRRELEGLCERGHEIRIAAIRFRHEYRPRRPIQTRRIGWIAAVLGQPVFALSRPKLYFRLLALAISSGSIVDFLLAWPASRHLRHSDVLFATFADHKLFVGFYCSQILDTPLVAGVHCFELYDNPNPALFEKALAACSRIQTVTEFNRSLLVQEHAVPEERVDVVRCTVDLEASGARRFALLVVAHFEQRKGYDTLFRALQRIDAPELQVWVVGDRRPGGDSRRERSVAVDVRALARDLGVADRVVFFGALPHDAVLALLSRCDAFCLPARTDERGIQEGFPVALAEAMAAGKPTITTRHAGIPEAVAALLVDEDDAEALAETIEGLIRDPERGLKVGAENRAAADRLFTGSNIDRLEALLTRAASERGAPRYAK